MPSLPALFVARAFGLAVTLLVFGLLTPAGAGSPAALTVDRVVFPSGSFPADVVAVQAAANGGGRVLLKAVNGAGVPTAFNFGPAVGGGFVQLQRDVQLIGERTATAATTVRGGRTPLRGADLPIRVHIEGISFDGPGFRAINLNRLTSAAVVGNHIRGLVGADVFGDGSTLGIAIGDGCCRESFRVVGNLVERLHADQSIAIVQCCGGPGSVVEIAGNRVVGPYFVAIESAVNEGRVVVADNQLEHGAGGGPMSFGDGIVVLGTGRYHVTRNTLRYERAGAAGISVVGDDFFGANQAALVDHNLLEMSHAFWGIGLSIQATGAAVANNRLRGSADFGLVGVGFGDPAASITANGFVGNNLGAWSSTVADLFFDTPVQGTVYVGHAGTVIDLGSGNAVSGLTAVGPGAPIGPRVAQVIARRQQAMGARGGATVTWPSYRRSGSEGLDR